MSLFVALMLFWAAVLFGGRLTWRFWGRWRKSCQLHVARSMSEIRNAAYFGRLSKEQFQNLVEKVLVAHKWVWLGDPWLGARHQGYLWDSGKKVVLVDAREKRLTAKELTRIAQEANRVKANRVLIFSPFKRVPAQTPPRLEVLFDSKLCSWFSILPVVPPKLMGWAKDLCSCGAPAEERVSRTGRPVMSCTRFPDCLVVREKPRSVRALPTAARRSIKSVANLGSVGPSASHA